MPNLRTYGKLYPCILHLSVMSPIRLSQAAFLNQFPPLCLVENETHDLLRGMPQCSLIHMYKYIIEHRGIFLDYHIEIFIVCLQSPHRLPALAQCSDWCAADKYRHWAEICCTHLPSLCYHPECKIGFISIHRSKMLFKLSVQYLFTHKSTVILPPHCGWLEIELMYICSIGKTDIHVEILTFPITQLQLVTFNLDT